MAVLAQIHVIVLEVILAGALHPTGAGEGTVHASANELRATSLMISEYFDRN